MELAAALDWLYGRQALGIKLGLAKVERLLAAVGDPHRAFRSVHIAGTNGKGTVTHLVADTLHRSGHRVGRFTSPHLERFNERIVVDGQEIPDEDVVRLVERLQGPTVELDADDQHPTFFELTTAMAFLWFQEQGVEWAVVEAGMGGRLDATNVLSPNLTIITNVGMDHQRFLGDHILDIAAEKAGIMKPGIPCVTGATGEALVALKAASRARQVAMSILDEDYLVEPDVNGFALAHPAGSAHYDLGLVGEHQIRNAAIAVAACDALRERGVDVPAANVQAALAEATMPGRMETMGMGGMQVLMDGAHNMDGAVALRRHFAHMDMAGFHLIVGFNEDKPWQDMLAQWVPLAAHVTAVPLRSGRTLDPASMRETVGGIGIPFHVEPDAASALQRAKDAGAGQVVVAGSLFLVGEARAVLKGRSVEGVRGDQ